MKALRCLLAAVVLALLLPAAPAVAAPAAPASTLAAPAAPNVDFWGTACNIVLTPVLGATRGACTAGKIAAEKGKDEIDEALQDTIVKPMADGMGEFTAQVLKTGLTWWLTTPSVQVKDSGVTHEETGKMPDGTTVTFSLQALMLGIGQIIAVLLVMFAGFRAMIQRKGKPLADALQGMLINVLVCTLGIVVIDSLLIASDQLTSAIINVAFQDSDKLTWLCSRVASAVVHGFGRHPFPRSGDVHEFCQHRGACQDSIGVFPVKGPGHAADVEGRAVRGDPAGPPGRPGDAGTGAQVQRRLANGAQGVGLGLAAAAQAAAAPAVGAGSVQGGDRRDPAG